MSSSLPASHTFQVHREETRLSGPALVLVLRGEVRVRDQAGGVRLGEGDVLTVRPGSACRLQAPDRSARVQSLRADPSWVERALGLVGLDFRSESQAFFVDRAGSDGALRAGRLLRETDACDRSDRSAALRAAARFFDLLAHSLEARPLAPPRAFAGRAAEARRRALVEAVEALRVDSLDEVSLAWLAERLGLSERQASRLFKEVYGTTFREHVAELRLERAKSLLRASELSIVDIAGETGWSSLGHFNEVFRRRVGQTPSAFRNAAREPAAA